MKKIFYLFLSLLTVFSFIPNVSINAQNGSQPSSDSMISQESLERIVAAIYQDENGRYAILEEADLIDEETQVAELTIEDMNSLGARQPRFIVEVLVTIIATFLLGGVAYGTCTSYKSQVYFLLNNWNVTQYSIPFAQRAQTYVGGWLFVNSCNAKGW